MQEYKQSEDLEIYEMDYNNNVQLQEICNVKQPIIFDIEPIFPTIIETTKAKYQRKRIVSRGKLC
jgi:hypothetical protein